MIPKKKSDDYSKKQFQMQKLKVKRDLQTLTKVELNINCGLKSTLTTNPDFL